VSALAQIRGIAQDVGSELASLGINVNFAPVCDVLTEATNTSIGDRAFGVTPDSVTSRAGSFLEGLHEAGVLGCLKHFPGQGAATVDTHVGGATVALTRHELEQTHLPPFRSLLPFAPMVMISHCIYPALGPGEASSSKAIITGLLKDELGYNGVVVSDDMNMGAVPQDPAHWQDAIINSVAAGVDMVLVCRHLERYELAHEALTREASRSSAFRERLEDAASRMTSMRKHLRSLSV
jgi:beta-N-acetylhexosaminidase